MEAPRAPDVVLLFPRGVRPPQQLWVHRSFLVAASPYYASLFETDMAETRLVPATEPLGDLKERIIEAGDMTDSDAGSEPEDTKDIDVGWRKEGLAADAYRIVVRDASYITYKAVLGHLMTNQITFARLRSRGLDRRAEGLRKHATKYPESPTPVSPKQVFAVANKLELGSIKVRTHPRRVMLNQQVEAVKDLARQVDVRNVVVEGFGNATAYPEVEKVLLDKLARHWTFIRDSQAHRTVEQVRGLDLRALTWRSKRDRASGRGSMRSTPSSSSVCAVNESASVSVVRLS